MAAKGEESSLLLDMVAKFLNDEGFSEVASVLVQKRGKTMSQSAVAKAAQNFPSIHKLFESWKKSHPELVEELQKKEEDSDSSDSSSDSDSDSDSKADHSDDESSDSGSDSDSDSSSKSGDETQNMEIELKKNQLKRKAESSESESSNSESDSDSDMSSSEEEKRPAKRARDASPENKTKVTKPETTFANTKPKERVKSIFDEPSESSSDSESDSESDGESDSEESEAAHKTGAHVEDDDSDDSSSESDSDSSDSDSDSDGSADSKTKVAKAGQSSESDSDSDSDSSESEAEFKVPAKTQSTTNGSKLPGIASVDSSVTVDITSPDQRAIPFTLNSSQNSKRKAEDHDSQDISNKQQKISTPSFNGNRFRRVPENLKVDPKFASNAYVPNTYADKAHEDLVKVKGRGFTKEKNKKKRGSYRGGAIDMGVKSIKFD